MRVSGAAPPPILRRRCCCNSPGCTRFCADGLAKRSVFGRHRGRAAGRECRRSKPRVGLRSAKTRLAEGDLAGRNGPRPGLRLHSMFDRRGYRFPGVLEGALNLAQGDLGLAARFTDLAIAVRRDGRSGCPLYLLMHQRGEIRAARGDQAGRLADFGAAVALASRWRQEIPPSISSLTAANIEFENRVFDSFIEAAAERALRSRDERWVERSLAAVERNRAHSLLKTVSFIDTWRGKLRPEYWEAQGQLRAESARLLRAGQTRSSESDRWNWNLPKWNPKRNCRFPAIIKRSLAPRVHLYIFKRTKCVGSTAELPFGEASIVLVGSYGGSGDFASIAGGRTAPRGNRGIPRSGAARRVGCG